MARSAKASPPHPVACAVPLPNRRTHWIIRERLFWRNRVSRLKWTWGYFIGRNDIWPLIRRNLIGRPLVGWNLIGQSYPRICEHLSIQIGDEARVARIIAIVQRAVAPVREPPSAIREHRDFHISEGLGIRESRRTIRQVSVDSIGEVRGDVDTRNIRQRLLLRMASSRQQQTRGARQDKKHERFHVLVEHAQCRNLGFRPSTKRFSSLQIISFLFPIPCKMACARAIADRGSPPHCWPGARA